MPCFPYTVFFSRYMSISKNGVKELTIPLLDTSKLCTLFKYFGNDVKNVYVKKSCAKNANKFPQMGIENKMLSHGVDFFVISFPVDLRHRFSEGVDIFTIPLGAK